MRPAAALRAKLAATDGPPVTGMLVGSVLWPGIVELAKRAGLDYLIIDLEHLPFSAPDVVDVCAAGRVQDFAVLVRAPETSAATVRAVLDLGPCGLLLPAVESAATLDAIADAAWVPPRGTRRPGGAGLGWVTGVDTDNWQREVEADLLVWPQIETRAGLADVEAIAAHPLVSSIAVGPYDLSAQLGVCWQPDAPELVAALARIRAAGQAAGKEMWMIGNGATLAAAGYRLLCLGEIGATLAAAITTAVTLTTA